MKSVRPQLPELVHELTLPEEEVSIAPLPESAHKDEKEAADLALKSTQLPTDLVTETLADVYANQGKFDKAITIYKALTERFPEKSGYFAAKIKRLQGP